MIKIIEKGFVVALVCCLSSVKAQESRHIIANKLVFERTSPDNTLVVEGAQGSIEVEGYEGDTVQIEAERIIQANNQEDIERGEGQITFQVFRKGRNEIFFKIFRVDPKPNTIYVYLLSPGSLLNARTGRFYYNDTTQSSYNYLLNFRIRVPVKTNLSLSTIAMGNIKAKNIIGSIEAKTLQGSIVLGQIAGPTRVNTQKGDVNVTYQENPNQACRYVTEDGNIIVTYKAGLEANITYEAEKELQTDFSTSALSRQSVKIGNGGVSLEFRARAGGVTLRYLK